MLINVSVIVPAYNDDDRLNKCVQGLVRLPENYEFVIAKEKGKGVAIVNAVRRARGKIIVTCDTDFMQQGFIPDYVEQFKESDVDILVGKRIIKDKPILRRVSSSLYNFFKQVLFGALPDTQSGFKIFKKEAVLELFPFLLEGFAWDTEFIVKAKEANMRVVETSIIEIYSKGTVNVKHGFNMALDLAKLWMHNRWNALLLFVSLTYLFGLIFASICTAIPIGTDVHFHYEVANYYANFQNGMISQPVMELNRFPYPPLFHLLLVPSIWLNVEYLFAKSLQVILPFLIYLSAIVFVRYYTNPKTQITTALLLLSTMGFVDGTIQARPQGLTMLFIPLALFAFIEYKNNKFAFASGLIAYTHGIAGLANIWLLTLYGFVRRNWKRTFTKIALLIAPMMIITLVYIGGALKKWGGIMDTYQEYLIFTRPQEMIPYYGGVCLMGYMFLADNLKHWTKTNLTEKTLSLSLLGLTVMIPFWADRYLQYSTITLACLAAIGLNKHKRSHNIILVLILVMYVLVTLNLYWVTLTNNWWLYPQ